MIGLHSVHYVLSENKDFDAFLRSVRGVAISLREGDRVAAWTTSASDFPRIVRNEVKVLDQSLSGYRLQWDNLDGLRVRVGELLALAPPAEDGGPQDWMIGTIRWLRLLPTGELETGVALLSRRALPLGLRTFDKHRVPRAPLRGLLLESLTDDGESQAETILAPHLLDRGAGEVEVMRPADPFDAIPEPKVEVLERPRIVELGSAYVQIFAGARREEADAEQECDAPTNDDLALAAGSDS